MNAAAKREPIVPLLMKQKAAAAFLGVSVSEFWNLRQRGAIPGGVLLPGQKRGQVWHRDVLSEVADRLVKR